MSFRQSMQQKINNNSPRDESLTLRGISFTKDNCVVKQMYYSKNWDKQELQKNLDAQIELAKNHNFVLNIIEYNFISNTHAFKQQCLIKYNCSKNAQSLLKIIEFPYEYSLTERLEIFDKLKQIKESLVQHQIIHGNLKPSNVIYDNDQIYLTDFKMQIPSIKTGNSEKQNYYPYLSVQVLKQLELQQLQPDMLIKLDYIKQDQYAIEVMILQLFSKFNFQNDLDTLGDWIQAITCWKNEIKKNKFRFENLDNEFQFIEVIKQFLIFQDDNKQEQKLNQRKNNYQSMGGNDTKVINTPINQNTQYQILHQHTSISQLINDIKNSSFIDYCKWLAQQGNQDYYKKINFEIINVVQELDNTIHCLIEEEKIFIGKFQSLIFNKQLYFLQGEVIENHPTQKNTVKHYKNVQSTQNELCGDDCEIIWWSIFQQNQIQKQQYYKGQLKNSKQHGQGELVIYIKQQPRLKYQGQWQDGKRSGQGVQELVINQDYSLAENQIYKYEGSFKNDRYDGQGKAYYDRLCLQYHQGMFVQGCEVGKHYICSSHTNHPIKVRYYFKFLCWKFCKETAL